MTRPVSQMERDRKDQVWDWAVCPRCKATMKNHEPPDPSGEFHHPINSCKNSGAWMQFHSRGRTLQRTPTVERWKRKKDRRARSQGARLARKLRPR